MSKTKVKITDENEIVLTTKANVRQRRGEHGVKNVHVSLTTKDLSDLCSVLVAANQKQQQETARKKQASIEKLGEQFVAEIDELPVFKRIGLLGRNVLLPSIKRCFPQSQTRSHNDEQS